MRDRTNVVVAAAYAVIAYAMAFPTWPARLRTHIPGDSGDALLNLWIVHWGGHHVDDGWAALWDTTIFHPHDRTLAYSESLLPVALVHRVLAFVVRSDVLAFNLLYLAAWTASMYLAYLLARRLTGSAAGAFVAGLVFTLATPRLGQYAHFQLAFAFLVPAVVLLALRLVERPSPGRGAALGAVTAMLALASSYYGLMVLVALACMVPVLVVWTHGSAWRPALAALAVAGAVFVVLVAPVANEYRRLQEDPHFRRSPSTDLSAHPGDFVRVMPGNHLLAELPPFEERSRPERGTIENRLFPGSVGLALGGIGAFVLARRMVRREVATFEDRALVLIAGAAAVLVVLAFGARLVWGPVDVPMPYAALDRLPGFSSIRAPSRFVAFGQLALALLAAVGFRRLTEGRSPRIAGAAVAIATAVVVAESAMAIELTRVPDAPGATAVNRALAELPAGAVVELPIATAADGAPWPFVETPRMWLSRIDGNERIGGYSGFEPPDFAALVGPLDGFPNEQAFERLDELGVRYVVLRTRHPVELPDWQRELVDVVGMSRFSEAEAERIAERLRDDDRVAGVGRHGDAWLVELRPAGTVR